MPQWTLAGVQDGYLLKPDKPRTDDDGKRLKYEAPAGSVPHLDISPDARHVLDDPDIPLSFTEGNKKSDAHWSQGEPCISLTGVWMFLHDRLVVPDLDEIALEGRRVRIIFDSDVTRKPSVAEALLRFAAALDRRGAKVEIVYLPEPDNGGKTGLDDFYAAGGTVADLDALAVPWDGKGPGVWVRDHATADVDELRAELAESRALNSALVQTFLNPNLTHAEKMAAISVASLTMTKRHAGQVEPDGRVALSASEVADDWRPTPRGEPVAPVNPKSGTKPRMPRSSVRPILQEAVERGLLEGEVRGTIRRRDDGSTYKDWEYLVEPARSFVDLLNPWTTWCPEQPKTRKTREPRACPQCGEVHPIRRIDYCTGCGAQVGEEIITPLSPADSADVPINEDAASASPMSRKNSDIQTSPEPPSSAALVRNVAKKFRHTDELPVEPEWLDAAPDPVAETPWIPGFEPPPPIDFRTDVRYGARGVGR